MKLDDSQSRALIFLARMQNADGGWGYRQGGASYVEPTAVALMAHSLLAAPAPESAWRWLRSAQRADGAWGIDHAGASQSWMSAWAVWTLAGTPTDTSAADRGARWLLEVPVLQAADAETMAAMRHLLDLDASLTGWPWQPGEAAWVLPTGLSMLALTAAGYGRHALLNEGAKYLVDRRCGSGGWNWGNPVMLGKALPATIPETALALLALRALGLATDHPAVQAGLGFLGTSSPDLSSGSEDSWRLLGLKAWDRTVPGLQESVVARQQDGGGWGGSPFITSVALLAMAPASPLAWRRS